jgi:diguanylate cyclase (GGDEF)-like protein
MSALLPITGFAVLAFVQVTDELHQQTESRLHSASRAAGMRVFDRLSALEVELASLDSSLMDRAGADRIEPGRRERLAQRFRTIWMVASGEVHELLGDSRGVPGIDLQGRTAALVLDREADRFAIYLARRLEPTSESSVIVVGEVDPSFLFDISHENALPPSSEFVLLDSQNQVLTSSWEGSQGDLPLTASMLLDAGNSLVEWRLAETTWLARSWSLFLEASYGQPSWTMIVAEPKEIALAPIARFRTGFPLIVGGAVALIVLLTTGQIRRRLVPLETLRAGTERIARREFDVRLSVSSRDEFEEVASSFNAMAGQLSDHFESLSRLADIDREILSATEEARMVETLVIRASEIYPCDAVGVRIEAPKEGASPRLLWFRQGAVSETRTVPLLEAERAELRRNPLQLHIELGPKTPRYLSSVPEQDLAKAVILPLLNGPALLGLLAFCHRTEDPVSEGRILYARQLADQFSSALSELRAQTENYELTHFDPLTGLPNRKLFEERVREALVQARRREEIFAVFAIDLDGFKRINSAMGNFEGDRLLVEVATRLSASRSIATVGRMGGDEFGILIRELMAEDDALGMASAVVAAASKPIQLANGEEYYPTFSGGVAVFPSHAGDAESLVLKAAVALDEAKDSGGDDCRVYIPTFADRARHQLSMESQLRRALDREELCVYYQPVVDLERDEIVGAEALLRWQHPERGLVLPDDFIALAEETGLIVQMGELALRQTCVDAQRWGQVDLAAIRVNVNLSGRQLREGNLLGMVRRVMLETNTVPASIGLELTESMLMNVDTATVKTLEALSDLGIRLYVDDFGTGYSSLSYLSQLPVDVLKVDQSFIRGIPDDPTSVGISRAIIALAVELSLGLVAEGVETVEQATFLRQHGCELVQGALFSMPLAKDEFQTLLQEWSLPS